jgi:membrane protease YdiL (CAAX protease family)
MQHYLRAAVAWLILLVLFLILKSAAEGVFGPYSLTRHTVAALSTSLVAVPAILAMWRLWDRRPLAELGLAPNFGAFALGALSWLIPSLVAMAALTLSGLVSISPARPWLEIALFIPYLALLVFFLEALPEELAFRGYIQGQLTAVLPRYWAVGLQAVLFMLWGAALWTVQTGSLPLDRVGIFLGAGFVLGLVRAATGSVWGSIGLHVAFQVVAQLLLSTDRAPAFAIGDAATLTLIAIGIVPFAAAAMLVETFAARRRLARS